MATEKGKINSSLSKILVGYPIQVVSPKCMLNTEQTQQGVCVCVRVRACMHVYMRASMHVCMCNKRKSHKVQREQRK